MKLFMRAAGERFGMTARERCLAYRVAIQTGLRAGELRSLKRGSFNLDDRQPFVKADSGTTKNRQTAYQYTDRELSNDLRDFLLAVATKQVAWMVRYGAN